MLIAKTVVVTTSRLLFGRSTVLGFIANWDRGKKEGLKWQFCRFNGDKTRVLGDFSDRLTGGGRGCGGVV